MLKRILLAGISAFLVSTVSFATIRPVVILSSGFDRTNVYSTKSITFIDSFQNDYLGSKHLDSEPLMGIFVGAYTPFANVWEWQYGVTYFQTSSFQANGNVNQFGDPAFNNFTYQYQIQSRRISFESKLARTVHEIWHPYVVVSVGEAINKAYAYMESPITSDAVPTDPFVGHTQKSFTYSVGLGADLDIAQHLRLGAGYRYVSLGSASLGQSPLQINTNTISNSHLNTNEFLVQLSYLA